MNKKSLQKVPFALYNGGIIRNVEIVKYFTKIHMRIEQEHPSHHSYENKITRPEGDALLTPARFSREDIEVRLAQVAGTTREFDHSIYLVELLSTPSPPSRRTEDRSLDIDTLDIFQDSGIPAEFILEAEKAHSDVIHEGQTDDPAILTRAAVYELWAARSLEKAPEDAQQVGALMQNAKINIERAKELVICDPHTTEADVLPLVVLEADIKATGGNALEASLMLEGAIARLEEVPEEVVDLAFVIQQTGHVPMGAAARVLLAA